MLIHLCFYSLFRKVGESPFKTTERAWWCSDQFCFPSVCFSTWPSSLFLPSLYSFSCHVTISPLFPFFFSSLTLFSFSSFPLYSLSLSFPFCIPILAQKGLALSLGIWSQGSEVISHERGKGDTHWPLSEMKRTSPASFPPPTLSLSPFKYWWYHTSSLLM